MKVATQPICVSGSEVSREVGSRPLHSRTEFAIGEVDYPSKDGREPVNNASNSDGDNVVAEEHDTTNSVANSEDEHVANERRIPEEACDATFPGGRNTIQYPEFNSLSKNSHASTVATTSRQNRDVIVSNDDHDSTRWSESSEDDIATKTREAPTAPVRRPPSLKCREIEPTAHESQGVRRFTRPAKKLNAVQEVGQELAKWERFRRHTLDKAKDILRRRLRPTMTTGTAEIAMAETTVQRGKRAATIGLGQISKLSDGNRGDDQCSRRGSIESSFRSTNSGVESFRNVRAATAIFEGKMAFRNRTRCSTDSAGELWREVVRAASKFDLEEWRKQM
eukprot:GEMP01036501.1.p1 GENE.GEMP01036501.1~~GEMP01036501.1.p1  ORF type:complete len:391 (+),score=61.65 GEMP01036501.1:167-1174(+)